MLKHKRYMDIENFKAELALKFNEGDHIIIQEKLDGSNVSFQYDSEEDKVICFSRNQILSEDNTLRGYYDCVKEEPEVVNQFEQFGKYSGPIVTKIVKKMIAEKEQKDE